MITIFQKHAQTFNSASNSDRTKHIQAVRKTNCSRFSFIQDLLPKVLGSSELSLSGLLLSCMLKKMLFCPSHSKRRWQHDGLCLPCLNRRNEAPDPRRYRTISPEDSSKRTWGRSPRDREQFNRYCFQ
jgi:hypothetical protein